MNAVVLAAGLSARMGSQNKLLLRVDGASLLRRTLDQVRQVSFAQMVVVLGHQASLLQSELPSGVDAVFNPNFSSGMHSSIKVGLRRLVNPLAGVAIVLADQPDFSSAVLDLLCQKFLNLDGPRLVYPEFGGQRGHPVLISADFFPEILAHPDGDHGCYYLFKNHPEAMRPLITDRAAVLQDVDTPEAWDEYQNSLREHSKVTYAD